MKLLDFAIRMELNGKAYYERLAAETTVVALQVIFRDLAADEQKHCDTIRGMQQGICGHLAETTVVERSRGVFGRLVRDTGVVGMREALDGLRHARKLESDSIRLYRGMAGLQTDPDRARLIEQLADQEAQHYEVLDNLYDFALRPKYATFWRGAATPDVL